MTSGEKNQIHCLERIQTMDWSEILAVPPNELSTKKLELIKSNLSSVDSNDLTADQLRGFFELSCFIIENSINDDQKSPKRGKYFIFIQCTEQTIVSLFSYSSFYIQYYYTADREAGRKKVTVTNEKDESYYIETIQEVSE